MKPLSLPQARVLMALVAVYDRDGRAALDDVAEVAGRSKSTTWVHLVALRDAGWVAFDPWQRRGNLRPLARWERCERPRVAATLAGQTSGPGVAATTPDLAGTARGSRRA